MIIANPLYDVVFKNLMKDNRIATFFLETLLEEVIESLVLSPQEYSMLLMYQEISEELYQSKRIERMGINLIRLDYVATIRLKSGKTKKVLIEIQKARKEIDVMRFRNYLAEHYKKEDELVIKGVLEKVALPIVTIYLLGFNLNGINSAAIKVDRHYIDLLTKSVIPKKSDFIEQLTHDSYVVQLKRIESRFQTRLERMLTVFEQHYFTDKTEMIKQYFPDENNEDMIKEMVDVLHFTGTDPESRKKIEDEQEAERFLEVQFGKDRRKLMKKEAELKEKNFQLEEKDKAIMTQHKAIEEKDKSLEEKDKLIQALQEQLKHKK